MSLNGLETVEIQEAHEAALAETGGWVLLKYAARDEVELLGSGAGGVADIKNVVEQHGHSSPLFGFLRYRRRSVLIKYVPEECSRLIKARVTVHINAIIERFPHDALLPIGGPGDLKDTTLSAACSLHTASGSTSSSTSSIPKRQLGEIAEDTEEEPKNRQGSHTTSHPIPDGLPVIGPPCDNPTANDTTTSTVVSNETLELPSNIDTDNLTLPLPRSVSAPNNRPVSPVKSIHERRQSSQSYRPDSYSYNLFGSNGKPKVKLAPRPSLDRQHSSGTTAHRPISTLPAGLRIVSKILKQPEGRMSLRGKGELPAVNAPPPPVPESPAIEPYSIASRPNTNSGRPTTSSGWSVRSVSTNNMRAGITPEKARLMKALEMRKKQKIAAAAMEPEESLQPDVDECSDTLVSSSIGDKVDDESSGLEHGATDVHVVDADETKLTALDIPDVSNGHESESDVTRTISTSVSPVECLEFGPSTQASSISGSTDETVQECKALKAEDMPLPHNVPDSKISESGIDGEELSTSNLVVAEESLSAAEPEAELNSNVPSQISALEDASTHKAVQIEHPHISTHKAEPNSILLKRSLAEDGLHRAEDQTVGESSATNEVQKTVVKEPKEWKIPRSKFSMQNLKHYSEPIPSDTMNAVPKPAFPVDNKTDEVVKAPRSSYSTHDLQAHIVPSEQASSTSAIPTNSTETSACPERDDPLQCSSASFDTIDSATEEDPFVTDTLERPKRKTGLEPIRTDLSTTDRSEQGTDEDGFSSDDELMHELQSATLHEAMPVSVSKSPLTPIFQRESPNDGSGEVPNDYFRAKLAPVRRSSAANLLSPPSSETRLDSPRSVSASAVHPQPVSDQHSSPLVAKKVNLGSGISQRIKALEKLSVQSADNLAPANSNSAAATSAAFFSVRKSSVRIASRSPSVAERANSLTNATPPPLMLRDQSPEMPRFRNRSGSIKSIKSKIEAFTPPKDTSIAPRPEAVQATAKIIHDPSSTFSDLSIAGSNSLPASLKKSSLPTDHQKAVVGIVKEAVQMPSAQTSIDGDAQRRSSMTVVRDFLSEGKKSFNDRRKSTTTDLPASPPLSPSSQSLSIPKSSARPVSVHSRRSSSSRDISTSPGLLSPSGSEETVEKSRPGSRAARMLRRVSSSLIGGVRKSVSHTTSPSLPEEPEPVAAKAQTSQEKPSIVIEIGDVNVQFPDSLLWKRRYLRLDDAGYLMLSQTQGSKGLETSAVIKRYHVKEFRSPYIPDVDAQELPNSVVLDFTDGGGLQIACEDRGGQAGVLTVLQQAHQRWTSPEHTSQARV